MPSVDEHAALIAEIRSLAERTSRADPLDVEAEDQLSRAFFEFTPVGAVNTERPAMLVEQLERSAAISPLVPVDSKKPVGRIAKRLVRKLVFWYMSYVAGQMLRFASYATRLIIRHEERLTEIEEKLSMAHTPVTVLPEDLSEPIDLSGWSERVVGLLQSLAGGVTSEDGSDGPVPATRVLHAGCQDGLLVKQLRDAGVDAYGVDPRWSLVDAGLASDSSLDLREEEIFSHLASVGASSLAGALLTGFIEQLERHRLPQLLDVLRAVVAPGGLIVVVSVAPEAWARTRSTVDVDLAPARPLHASTWTTLLARQGFSDIDVSSLPGAYCVVGRRGP